MQSPASHPFNMLQISSLVNETSLMKKMSCLEAQSSTVTLFADEKDSIPSLIVPNKGHLARASEPAALHDLGDSTATLFSSNSPRLELETKEEKDVVFFPDGLSLLLECIVAEMEYRKPKNGVVINPLSGASLKDHPFVPQKAISTSSPTAKTTREIRSKSDVNSLRNTAELIQLEVAWNFCLANAEKAPGPMDVLQHLKNIGCDNDYNKKPGSRLLPKNAATFFKKVLDFGSKPHCKVSVPSNDTVKACEAAALLLACQYTTFGLIPSEKAGMKRKVAEERFSSDDEGEFKHYDEDIDADEDDDFLDPCYQSALSSTYPTKKPISKKQSMKSHTNKKIARTSNDTESQATVIPKPVKPIGSKGLSRHSPYGTRFSAEMEDGTFKSSFLAGDLTNRIKSRGSRSRGELLLILHAPEIQQLETAWEFVSTYSGNPGAAMVLEHLRSLGLDANHRKQGSVLLQKNAGNFFKRVQEFGKRRALDPFYLKVQPSGISPEDAMAAIDISNQSSSTDADHPTGEPDSIMTNETPLA